MSRFVAFVVAPLAMVTYSGCPGGRSDLVRRASFDLSCPEAQINVVDLGGGTRGVSGCGHRATYVFDCDVHGFGGACEQGNWVMNSTSGGDSGGR